MDQPPPENQRRFSRVAKHWFLHYDILERQDQGPNVASLQNLSAVGVCFRTEEFLEIGALLRMKFDLSLRPLDRVRGRVMWGREVRKNQFEYGVVFEGLALEEIAEIDRFVAKKRHGA